MDSKDFIAAIKAVACENGSKGILETIRKPPGRDPDPELLGVSRWFNGLLSEDKEIVQRIVHLATTQAVYNVFLAIDGLLAISPHERAVQLELFARDSTGFRVLLNDPATAPLTHLFKEVAPLKLTS